MSISGGVDKSIERGHAVGCDTIQIFTKSSNQWRAKPLADDEIDRFRSNRDKYGIHPVVAHDSYLINLASPDRDGLLKKSREAFLVEMERSERLAIPFLVMHPGSHLGAGVDSGIRTIAESFDWLFSRSQGNKLLVLLETTAGQGTNIGFTFEQLQSIIDNTDESDRFGICLDTAHVYAAGYDIKDHAGYEEMWDEFDKILGLGRLKAIHLNDSKKDLASRVDRHEHIGKGALGLEPFRRLLNDPRFVSVPMILETPRSPDYAEDKENLEVLRGLIE